MAKFEYLPQERLHLVAAWFLVRSDYLASIGSAVFGFEQDLRSFLLG